MGQEKLSVVDESVIKAVGLFGGGVACSGYICGALLGAVAALSSVYSRGTLEEKESPPMRAVGARMVEKFEELTAPYGGVRCLDIARLDWKDPLAVKEFRTNPESRRGICLQVVGDTAYALGELIEKEIPAQ